MTRIFNICLFILLGSSFLFAQERVKKVSFYGNARTNLLHQNLKLDEDTVNLSKSSYGHSLIDLGVSIRPSVNTEILTELRMRNEFGGFYGGAVSFGVRRLTLKGVVNNRLRYKLGDIDLKMTPYTLFNNGYQDVVNEANIFSAAREVLNYENYYFENYWRRQGAQAEFGFDLDNKFYRELNFNLFTTRNIVTDGVSIPEQLFSGAVVSLINDYGEINYNAAFLHDLKGTVNDLELYRNLVQSFSARAMFTEKKTLKVNFEGGKSTFKIENTVDKNTDVNKDYFWNLGLNYKNTHDITVGFLSTGADFRSPGAQSIRLDYQSVSGIFPLVTNQPLDRSMGLLDFIYNDVLYRKTFDKTLNNYHPAFSNVLPYGLATPNRFGLYVSVDKFILNEYINASTKLYNLSEVIGSGTVEKKSFMLGQLNLDLNWEKISLKTGVKIEKTSRDGKEYEKIDLVSMLFDFGVDYTLQSNIVFMIGSKYHSADGNELIPEYNKFNEIMTFTPISIDNHNQFINSLGVKVLFNEKSTLTLSAHKFMQYQDVDYGIDQFQLLYRLNF